MQSHTSSSWRSAETTPPRMNSLTSMPEARMPAGSVQRRPLIHSMTSTRGLHRSRRTQGIFTVGSPLKLLWKSCTRHNVFAVQYGAVPQHLR